MQQIMDAAEQLADRFESYKPDPDDRRDPAPLGALRDAVCGRACAEAALVDAVAAARAAGYSWTTIGALLGTSGEAARQRYGQFADR
jgi:hypothetical protein